MGVHIDTSEVDRLAVDLSEAPGRLRTRAGQVMYVAANKVKKGMRSDLVDGMRSHGASHIPQMPSRINYDKRGQFEYEIGIDKEGQGNLGNFAAFGSSKNAPIFDHTAALAREAPIMADKLGDEAEDAVLGGAE